MSMMIMLENVCHGGAVEGYIGLFFIISHFIHLILICFTFQCSLCSLQVVRLHENSFEGELDANYGSLLALTELRLENNNLEGPIPAFWGFASLLEELTLFQNPGLTGPMPAEICTLVESGSLDRLVVDCTVECTCCTDCFDG